MLKLKDMAYVLRSKNAGPFFLTIDIIFKEAKDYERILQSDLLTKEKIARLYHCGTEDVQIYPYEQTYSIKVSFPRKAISGDTDDTDLFGAQHHMPLMELPINIKGDEAEMSGWSGREAWEGVRTTSVSDALQGLTNLNSAIKPVSDHLTVIGPAYPVRVRAADNLLVLRAIDEASPGDVLVIDAKGYKQNASCGDFVIGLAQTLGLAGVVIDGVVRDIQGIRDLDYPVFCRGTTVAASDKHGSGETGKPISCGGVPIHPGDLILGDIDGVTVIPRDIENEVLEKAREKQAQDETRERDIIGDPEAARAYIRKQLKQASR